MQESEAGVRNTVIGSRRLPCCSLPHHHHHHHHHHHLKDTHNHLVPTFSFQTLPLQPLTHLPQTHTTTATTHPPTQTHNHYCNHSPTYPRHTITTATTHPPTPDTHHHCKPLTHLPLTHKTTHLPQTHTTTATTHPPTPDIQNHPSNPDSHHYCNHSPTYP
ncbi:hypothetical protein Pcinc_041196 [Petrolisthes cinctipes]|uniref:Uncharacterized protein n=1 Tax=Petrolisthes cinctipes TaxID=88211 RepID=A0AAE1EI07_PETCI|nr:hypothetical protein Pcinc_041196 [Petrolisthes cinctipes]